MLRLVIHLLAVSAEVVNKAARPPPRPASCASPANFEGPLRDRHVNLSHHFRCLRKYNYYRHCHATTHANLQHKWALAAGRHMSRGQRADAELRTPCPPTRGTMTAARVCQHSIKALEGLQHILHGQNRRKCRTPRQPPHYDHMRAYSQGRCKGASPRMSA